MAEKLTKEQLADLRERLTSDFLERGEHYVYERGEGRLNWEKTLSGDSLSSCFCDARTLEEALKAAYGVARGVIVAMNPPFKVNVTIDPDGSDSFTDGKTVVVSTAHFDDKDLTLGEKMDAFVGVTVHEGCHLLHTDFEYSPAEADRATKSFANIVEDERIERECGEQTPGLAGFLRANKDIFYNRWKKRHPVAGEASVACRVVNAVISLIRYPSALRDDEIEEFGEALEKVKAVLLPFPTSTKGAWDMAAKIRDILVDLLKSEPESERRGGGGGEEGEDGPREPITDEQARRMIEEALEELEADEMVAPSGTSVNLINSEVTDKIMRDEMTRGENGRGFCYKADASDEHSKERYQRSLDKVRPYVNAVSQVLRCNGTDRKSTLHGLRSGRLDTNKLAEAVQGVQAVYTRRYESKGDRLAVCLLIDQSGSMYGRKMNAARDAAVLLEQALLKIPGIDLFIYGHTADEIQYGQHELIVYREKGGAVKNGLGACDDMCDNADGFAILDAAARVRKFTQDKCLMFVISDGFPAAIGYEGDPAVRHTREAVKKITRQGFIPVQVAIDPEVAPERMFDHWVKLTDLSVLPRALGEVVKKAVLKSSGRTVSIS